MGCWGSHLGNFFVHSGNLNHATAFMWYGCTVKRQEGKGGERMAKDRFGRSERQACCRPCQAEKTIKEE